MTDALAPLTDDELDRIERSAHYASQTEGHNWVDGFSDAWGDLVLQTFNAETAEEYIRTADPQTMLRLVAEVRRLRADRSGHG